MDETRGKDGFSAFNVLGFVYQCGEGPVKVEKLLQVGVGRQLLAVDGESARNGCAYYADDMLQAFDSC